MKRFAKVYLEITDVCNLNCSFCPGTVRQKKFMTVEEFECCLNRLKGYTDYLYFHLMGEPLLHPQLKEFLKMAGDCGFRVILTTNGTLLPKQQEMLLKSPTLHKVNISLHSFEANALQMPFEDYLRSCIRFGMQSEEIIVCYRLWNGGGANEKNTEIEAMLKAAFHEPWKQERSGIRIGYRTFLQHDNKFDWPSPAAEDFGENGFCYGLRDQLGVLCDGTVVPCCLDGNGVIKLGNLLSDDLETILNTERAQKLYNGFSCRKAVEPLCRHCGYATRFR